MDTLGIDYGITIVIVHGGSYIPYMMKDVCSSAFVIYCKVMKQRCKGSVVKKSKDADNYPAQILCGVVVELVLLTISQHRISPYWDAHVRYNNLGVVSHVQQTHVLLGRGWESLYSR